MIIKCPECGVEYSYGSNICHICNNNTILFGSIFFPPHKLRNWNYLYKNCYSNDMTKKVGEFENKSEESDNIEIIMKEVSHYKWNCFKSVDIINEVDRKISLVFTYE